MAGLLLGKQYPVKGLRMSALNALNRLEVPNTRNPRNSDLSTLPGLVISRFAVCTWTDPASVEKGSGVGYPPESMKMQNEFESPSAAGKVDGSK